MTSFIQRILRQGPILEEHLAGKRYLALLDSKATLVWHADARGIVDKASRERWHQLFGTRIVHLLDRQKSVHPEDRDRVVDLWGECLEKQISWETEYRLKQGDTYSYFLSKGVPVFEDSTLINWIGVSTNIEERKRAEIMMLEAKELAEGANRAKTDFLAMMSHELRTPLAAIMGYCEILSMGAHGPINTEMEQDLGRVLRASNHLLALINGILDFTKLEGGKLRMRSTTCYLKPLIEASFDIVKPLIEEKGHQYTFNSATCEDIRVRADAERVQQILVNLFSNATKFTPRNGKINVACRAQEKQILIDIEDNGIGMAPSGVSTIFDPFIQLDNGISRAQGGTGLGLTISQQLAKGMGGDIRVKSLIGEGSTFTLALPAVLKFD